MTDLIVARTGLSALDFSYNYDANGRVTSVTDHATPGENRTFTYDGLGRLSSATGPWGNASYTYDLLNNIREKQLGVHTVQIEYDTTNRISRARDTRDPESSSGQALTSGAITAGARAGFWAAMTG